MTESTRRWGIFRDDPFSKTVCGFVQRVHAEVCGSSLDPFCCSGCMQIGEVFAGTLAPVETDRDRLRAEVARLTSWHERLPEQHMRFGLVYPDGTTEMLPCADWCWACKLQRAKQRAERAEAEVERLTTFGMKHRERAVAVIARVRELRAKLARLAEAAAADSKTIPARNGNDIYADAYLQVCQDLDAVLGQAGAEPVDWRWRAEQAAAGRDRAELRVRYAEDAILVVEELARSARRSSAPPIDCTHACLVDRCSCSGNWPVGWTLDPAAVLEALAQRFQYANEETAVDLHNPEGPAALSKRQPDAEPCSWVEEYMRQTRPWATRWTQIRRRLRRWWRRQGDRYAELAAYEAKIRAQIEADILATAPPPASDPYDHDSIRHRQARRDATIARAAVRTGPRLTSPGKDPSE